VHLYQTKSLTNARGKSFKNAAAPSWSALISALIVMYAADNAGAHYAAWLAGNAKRGQISAAVLSS